jgi:hypothetical protein
MVAGGLLEGVDSNRELGIHLNQTFTPVTAWLGFSSKLILTADTYVLNPVPS